MKSVNTWILLVLACCWPGTVLAQLQLLPDQKPQQVFAGDGRKIAAVWHNAGNQPTEADIHMRVFQTSSATVVQLGERLWKKLQVLPGQTILESAQLDFPTVKAETKFLIQWHEGSNHLLGVTTVLVYPTNLLEELRPLDGGKAIGVFDPQNELKPPLKSLAVDFVDLGDSELTNFSGKLVVIGPFQSEIQMPDDLPEQIKVLAKKNVAVVWIQPAEKCGRLKPSFYSVPEKQVAVLIVQPDLVSNLSENPQAQLNLIYFCKLALNPQPPTLPDLASQP